jgi:hypothetical protein
MRRPLGTRRSTGTNEYVAELCPPDPLAKKRRTSQPEQILRKNKAPCDLTLLDVMVEVMADTKAIRRIQNGKVNVLTAFIIAALPETPSWNSISRFAPVQPRGSAPQPSLDV